MALEKRTSGKWSFYGTINGKRYRRSGFATKREAKAAEAEFRKQAEYEKEHIKMCDLIDMYADFKKGKIKDNSIEAVTYYTNKLSKDYDLYDKYVDTIDYQTLQNMFDDMYLRYKPVSIKGFYGRFNRVFNFALKNNYLDINPLAKVELASNKNEKPKEMLFYEPDEFKRLIKYADDDPMGKCILIILFYMGVRIGECLALTWDDIDFSAKKMNINKTVKHRSKKGAYTQTPKTSNSYRVITMPKVVINELKKIYEIERNYINFSKDMFIFSHGDKPISESTVRIHYDQILERANANGENLKRIRLHDFRHSHASYLINNMSAGFTDFDIAKRLGHSVSMLHKTYAHWFKSADKSIVDFMDKDI